MFIVLDSLGRFWDGAGFQSVSTNAHRFSSFRLALTFAGACNGSVDLF